MMSIVPDSRNCFHEEGRPRHDSRRLTTVYEELVNRAVERALVDRLIVLAGQAPNPQVRAVASASLRRLCRRAQAVAEADDSAAHEHLMAADIGRFLDRPTEAARPLATPEPPPGTNWHAWSGMAVEE